MKVLHHESSNPVSVSDQVFKRFLRFPPSREFEGAMADAATWTRNWFQNNGRPWCMAAEVDEALRRTLTDRWPDAEKLGVIVASAGPEAEAAANQCWDDDQPDHYYFLECYAAAVVDELLTQTREALGASTHYSPGYPEWSIAANVPLLSALKTSLTLPGPLCTLESGMLSPKKSQIAVFALPSL